jgi:hypothetical protein
VLAQIGEEMQRVPNYRLLIVSDFEHRKTLGEKVKKKLRALVPRCEFFFFVRGTGFEAWKHWGSLSKYPVVADHCTRFLKRFLRS